MKTYSLMIFAVFFALSSASAGFWDKVKEKTKEASRRVKKRRTRNKRIRNPKAVAAVRGLSEDEDEAQAGDEPRDYEFLEWLESIEVTDDDVNRFVKEGRLAP